MAHPHVSLPDAPDVGVLVAECCADSSLFRVENIKNVNRLLGRINPKDDAVGLVEKLSKILFEVLPLSGGPATRWEAFQGIDPVIQPLQPTGRVLRRMFVDVPKGRPDARLGLRRDNDPVIHLREIPRSLASSLRKSRIGRPSARLACSRPRPMPRMASRSSRSSRSFW